MLKLKKIVLTLGVMLGITTPLLAPIQAFALFDNAKGQVCSGVNLGSSSDCSPSSAGSITNVIKMVLDILSLVVGVIATIMMIVAGLKYITANGDAGNISTAKKTLIYALVGVVVVAVSQTLVQVVLNQAINATKPPANNSRTPNRAQ